MSENIIRVDASVDKTWQILSNGDLYDKWVVGAKNVRRTEGDWPDDGAKLHHTVGVGPLNLKDETTVESSDPDNKRLELRAKFRPLGEAHIVIDLRSESGGTEITMREQLVAGLGSKLPKQLTNRMLEARNAEALRRLKNLTES